MTAARPRLSLIVAVARNGVIGVNGQLPWRLPEDLKRFKALTMGHTLVMGRKTHESIGRLLPGRRTIIISRNPAYRVEGAAVVPSVEAAIAAATGESEVFVVGGGEIYTLALPLADRLLVTEVDLAPEGDAFFPPVDLNRWREVGREARQTEEGVRYAFADYERIVLAPSGTAA